MNKLLIIAHAPLASALRQCALHVFPDLADDLAALDVAPQASVEDSLALAQATATTLGSGPMLVMTDIFGATPSNVAQRLVSGTSRRLVAGVNLPMLLRAATYRAENLEDLVPKALAGGMQGVMPVAVTAPQNQHRHHDGNKHYHDQQ